MGVTAGAETTGEPRPLAGRRALVTGGATGIGRATVRRLAAEGARTCVNYIGDPAPAERLADEVSRDGRPASAIEADVSREDQVAELFRRAGQELGGPVDLLVNNAGIQSTAPLVEMSLEDWNAVLAVNLTGAFLCAREAARALLAVELPGVIVNVSSVHQRIPWPEHAHYAASKAGMALFGQSIARELAPRGVRVVTIAPGAIATERNEEVVEDEEARARLEEQIPWRRVGDPEEVAAAIAWLAGPEAEYAVGTTLFLDGGMTLYQR